MDLDTTLVENVALLVVGLGLLVKGSGIFVQAAGALARRFGVSDLVIGLTLVAVGTSLPELVAAIVASGKGESALVLGNVVGANIANLTLIVGGAAMVRTMPIEKPMLERDGYLALVTAALIGLFAFDETISRLEGALLVVLFLAYSIFLIHTSQQYEAAYHIRQFASYFFRFRYVSAVARALADAFDENPAADGAVPPQPTGWRNPALLIGSMGLIVVGGNLLVGEAVFFTAYFELPVTLVGVVLALGTTAPEMSVSITAARRGLGGMIIGNALGSVLCNGLLVLGTAAVVAPIGVSHLALRFALPCLLGVTTIVLVLKRTDREIRRLEGMALVGVYLAFLTAYVWLA